MSLAEPVLRLAATWAARVAGAEHAVALVRTAAGREVVQVGSRSALPDAFLDAMVVAVHAGRPCILSARARAGVRQAAAAAGVRVAVAVPVRARSASGCVLVAGGPVRFTAADVGALAAVAVTLEAALDEAEDALVAVRRSMHRVLHDGAGQTLASLVFAIRHVEDDVASAALRLRLRALRAQAAAGVREMRAILEHLAAGAAGRERVATGRARGSARPRV
jgi:hypothetical protein